MNENVTRRLDGLSADGARHGQYVGWCRPERLARYGSRGSMVGAGASGCPVRDNRLVWSLWWSVVVSGKCIDDASDRSCTVQLRRLTLIRHSGSQTLWSRLYGSEARLYGSVGKTGMRTTGYRRPRKLSHMGSTRIFELQGSEGQGGGHREGGRKFLLSDFQLMKTSSRCFRR